MKTKLFIILLSLLTINHKVNTWHINDMPISNINDCHIDNTNIDCKMHTINENDYYTELSFEIKDNGGYLDLSTMAMYNNDSFILFDFEVSQDNSLNTIATISSTANLKETITLNKNTIYTISYHNYIEDNKVKLEVKELNNLFNPLYLELDLNQLNNFIFIDDLTLHSSFTLLDINTNQLSSIITNNNCNIKDDLNCDGVVTCDEILGIDYIWDNELKTCVINKEIHIIDTSAK